MKYRVYDDRTNETLLETDDKWEAVVFVSEVDDESEDFMHVWISEKK